MTVTDEAKAAAKAALEVTGLGLTEFPGLKEALLLMLDSEIRYTIYRNFGEGWESYLPNLTDLERVKEELYISEQIHGDKAEHKVMYHFVSPATEVELG